MQPQFEDLHSMISVAQEIADLLIFQVGEQRDHVEPRISLLRFHSFSVRDRKLYREPLQRLRCFCRLSPMHREMQQQIQAYREKLFLYLCRMANSRVQVYWTCKYPLNIKFAIEISF